jgi:hypothetical protein
MADAARVPSGRSGREHLLALEQDDVGDAAAGQMIGDARAHAAAADDHDVSGWFHDRVQGSWFRGSGFVQGWGSRGAPFASALPMIAQRYQDLDCWQLSNDLKLRVYASAGLKGSRILRSDSSLGARRTAHDFRGIRPLSAQGIRSISRVCSRFLDRNSESSRRRAGLDVHHERGTR